VPPASRLPCLAMCNGPSAKASEVVTGRAKQKIAEEGQARSLDRVCRNVFMASSSLHFLQSYEGRRRLSRIVFKT
jgi:hypothetical protein